MGRKGTGKIKFRKENEGKIIKTPESSLPEIDYPVFCFRYLHKDYDLASCPDNEKIPFVERLIKLSQMSWLDLGKAQRHGFGWEKIPLASIKPDLPSEYNMTEDVKFLLAFRYYDKKPFLGVRNKSILHLLYIDHKRNIYDHGS